MAGFIDFLKSSGGLIFVGIAVVLGGVSTMYVVTTVKNDQWEIPALDNEKYSPDERSGGSKRRRKYHTKSRRRR
jgi:hypothetical protein